MNASKSIATLLLTGLLGASLIAQPGARERHPELRKEMHAYMEAHVLPVMQAQRNKLDASLSPQEQSELTAIRTEMKALRKETHAQAPKGRRNGDPAAKGEKPTEQQRAQFQASREQMHQLMERARPILEAHKTDISSLMDEIATEREQWHTDIQAMRTAQLGDRPEGERPHRPGDGMDRPPHQRGDSTMAPHRGEGPGHRGPGRGRPGMGNMQHPMGFLLWDGSAPERMEADTAFDLNIFPNPAASQSNLRYEVKTAGKVTIKLLNDQGNVIQNLEKESQMPGTYTETLQIEGLRPGVYIYQVTTASGTETGKVIIE